jgi:septal ring factor EnvC (AmiA/AmiB activator)
MKDFFTQNFKYILLAIFVGLLVFLLVRTYTEDTSNPKELQNKLDAIDSKIKDLNTNLDKYNDSISQYKKDIEKLDSSINNIRIQKKVVNNYYEEKATEIKVLTAKQVDSTLRKRYKY